MAISLYLCRAPEGAGPMNEWQSMLAAPLGTAESVKARFEALWPGLRWQKASTGAWSAHGEEIEGKRHIEVTIWDDFEGQCHFVVLRATPPSVIRRTMEALQLNHVCDPEAACLVDPFGYDDDDRYYARRAWPSSSS